MAEYIEREAAIKFVKEQMTEPFDNFYESALQEMAGEKNEM